MKLCPWCAESVQDQAIKCRYCFEMLPAPEASIEPVQLDRDQESSPSDSFPGKQEASLLPQQSNPRQEEIKASAAAYTRGDLARKAGNKAEALASYLEAVKLDPDNRHAHFGVKMYVPNHSIPASVQEPLPTTTNLPARIKPVSKKSKIDEHLKAAEDYESQPDGKRKAVNHYLAAAKLYLAAGNAKFCSELCEHVLELSPSNSKASALLASLATVESEEEEVSVPISEVQSTVLVSGANEDSKPKKEELSPGCALGCILPSTFLIISMLLGPCSSLPNPPVVPSNTINIGGKEITPPNGHIVTQEDREDAARINLDAIVQAERDKGKSDVEIARDLERDHPGISKLILDLDKKSEDRRRRK